MQVRNVLCAVLITGLAFAGCAAPPARTPEPTAASCAATGAFLDHRGMFGTAHCVLPYADGGRVCADKADCQGRCTVDLDALGPEGDRYRPGAKAVGRCQKDDAQFGCYAEIRGGLVVEAICVD